MSVYTNPAPAAWEADLTALLSALGYHSQARAEVIAHVNANGFAEGCETIEDPEDVARVNALLENHWDREADVLDWPDWTLDRYEPTALEEEWLSTELDRADAWLDRKALESRSLDNLARGLIPPDLAGIIAITRTGGHPA
jgi:hypothetical protein